MADTEPSIMMDKKLPPVPKPSLRNAMTFRFRALHLLVEVDFVEGKGKGWRWAVYNPVWYGIRTESPFWHRTAKSAINSAWAFLQREAAKTNKKKEN